MDSSTLLLLPGVWLGATLGFTVDKVTGESQTILLQQLFEDVLKNMIGLVKQGKVRESKQKHNDGISLQSTMTGV